MSIQFKISNLLKFTYLLACFPCVFYSQTGVSEKPPAIIQSDFSATFDPNKSDNFNSAVIDANKWTFRNQGGARDNTIEEVNWREGQNITFGKQDNSTSPIYVSIKASALGNLDHGSDGLASKFRTRYGFYILKFKIPGLVTGSNNRPVHHPAVWSAWKNFSTLDYRSVNKDENGNTIPGVSDIQPDKWVEVDFMEVYDNVPSWKSLTLTHDKVFDTNGNPSRDRNKQFFTDEPNLTSTSQNWEIIGFEFKPDLIRFWRYKNNQWEVQVKTLTIKDDATNATAFTNAPTAEMKTENADRDMYWLLSNVFFKQLSDDRDRDDDVYLDIDHFLYYQYDDGSLSTSDINIAIKEMTIYPNPTKDKLTIKTTGYSEKTSIGIYNLLGKMVLSKKDVTVGNSFEIDVNELEAGFYLLRLSNNNQSETKSFIKK